MQVSENCQDCCLSMGKKIAQLTKVIFQLHSKNEENDEFIKALKRSYEREIDSIVNGADRIIVKQSEALQTQIDSNQQSIKFKELLEQEQKQRNQTLSDIENYKKQIEEKEAILSKEEEGKLNKYMTGISDLKSKYDNQFKVLTEQLNKAVSDKETLELVHAKEIENHVKSHNHKYNELLKAKLTSEEKIMQQNEKEKLEITTKYEKELAEAIKKISGSEKTQEILEKQVSILIF